MVVLSPSCVLHEHIGEVLISADFRPVLSKNRRLFNLRFLGGLARVAKQLENSLRQKRKQTDGPMVSLGRFTIGVQLRVHSVRCVL